MGNEKAERAKWVAGATILFRLRSLREAARDPHPAKTVMRIFFRRKMYE